jgi:GH43 family beta-xylosidase
MRRFLTVLVVSCLGWSMLPGVPATAAPAPITLRNPINPGPDPSLVLHNGSYYLAVTLGDRLSIWRSASLAGLASAPERVVYRDPDNSRNKQVWAPAMYRFNSRWYIYYTASDGVDNNHRMYVVESAGDDPLGPYTFKGRLADFNEYSIDGEPFVHNGQMYFMWSAPGRGMGGPAQLYMSRMSDPWTTTGERVALPADGGCHEVREGANFLRRNGRLFLIYSTCDTGKPDYQLWMKSIADGADPMNPANWRQHPGPVFARNNAEGVYGPGHNGFFRSPDGTEDWIIYHGKTSSAYTYEGRTTRAQRFTWNADGTPNFGVPRGLSIQHTLPSGDPWRNPEALVTRSSRAFVADEQVHYFDRGTDGSLQHWWRNRDMSLSRDSWGGQLTGRPTGYAVGDEQHAFARGTDGRLKHWWWRPGASVQFQDAGGDIAGDPSGMVSINGQKHIFARASNGTLAHWWWEPDGTIRRDNWGGDLVGTPVAYTRGDMQHVFARGANNTLRHWYWFPGIAGNLPRLDDWGAVGRVMSDPTGFLDGDQEHVFYRTVGGTLEHRYFDVSDARLTTEDWGGQSSGTPNAFMWGNQQHVFARAADNSLRHWSMVPGVGVRTDTWSGAGTVTGDPVGLAWHDQQHVMARGSAGGLTNWRWSASDGLVTTNWAGAIAAS